MGVRGLTKRVKSASWTGQTSRTPEDRFKGRCLGGLWCAGRSKDA